MASAFTHAFAALALGKTCYRCRRDWRFWTLAVGSAVMPDADVIGFALGIEYGDMLGHRGLSHSLLFALLWSMLVVWSEFRQVPRYAREWWGLLVFFFVVTASHGVLDALTTGGLGVAFFAPFDATRYFFPWRPIIVSPIGVGSFFSHWGMLVLRSEILYVWVPLSVLSACVRLWRQVGTGCQSEN